MGRILTNPSFDEWVRHLFDHPVSDEREWYWEPEADKAELEPSQVVSYATEFFHRAGGLLAPYSDVQAEQGLWFLVGDATSPLDVLAEPSVPVELRVRCIRSMVTVFEQGFVPRCTPHLFHLDERGLGALNSICYMWWDVFPLRIWTNMIPLEFMADDPAARPALDAACLSVMEAALQLPSIACQESALHGLHHWMESDPGRCQRSLDGFLASHRDSRSELLNYAAKVREVGVL